MKQIVILILFISITACVDNNETKPTHEPFIGTWITIEAHKDAIPQSEWLGIQLVFKQNDIDSGTYQVIETPIDSIWHSNGVWYKSNYPNSIILDNSVDLDFDIKNDTLWLSKFLAEPGDSCIPGVPCPLSLNGQWLFKYRKE